MAYYIDVTGGEANAGTGTEGDPFRSWSQFIANASAPSGIEPVYIAGRMLTGDASSVQFSARNAAGHASNSSTNHFRFQPWPGLETDDPDTMPGIFIPTLGNGISFLLSGNWNEWYRLFLGGGGASSSRFGVTLDTDGLIDSCVVQSPNRCIQVGVRGKVRRNLLITVGGPALRGGFSSGAGDCDVEHNTAIITGTASVGYELRGANWLVRNNCIYTLPGGSVTTEYLFTSSSIRAGSSNNAGQAAAASQPVGLQTNYVQISSDPFVDSANGDFAPDVGSDLDSAGIASSLTQDAFGKAFSDPPAIGWLEAATLPAPTLTDVDTDETVTSDQTGVSVTGTGMGATETDRVFELVQGAVKVTQIETGTGSETAATLSIVIEQAGADIKFGAATLRVTRNDDGESGELAITVNPPSGQLYVDVVEVEPTADNRITAVPDIAAGDQLQARGVGGGAAPTGLQLNADGTFHFSSGNEPASFDVRVWDASDATWGAWATQTVGGTKEIAGALAVGFVGAGTLTGKKRLAGTIESAISMQGMLSALGALSGAVSLSAETLGVLQGVGALGGSTSTQFANLAALSALGELLGASTFTFMPQGAVGAIGTNTIEGTIPIAFDAMGALDATGTNAIEGTIPIAFDAVGALDATGTNAIEGTIPIAFDAVGALDATGTNAIEGTIPIAFDAAGAMNATGANPIQGTASIFFSPAAVLHGRSELEGAIPLTISAVGGLEALGNLLGSTNLTFAVNGSIHGAGDLEGSTHLVFTPEGNLLDGSTMNGRVFLALSPQGSMEAMGELAGSSLIVVTQFANLQGIRQTSGLIELGFTQTAQLFGKGDLLGQSLLAISPEAQLEVDSDLNGHIQISLSCIAEISGGVSISIVGDDLGFADVTAENSFGVVDGSMGFGEV